MPSEACSHWATTGCWQPIDACSCPALPPRALAALFARASLLSRLRLVLPAGLPFFPCHAEPYRTIRYHAMRAAGGVDSRDYR